LYRILYVCTTWNFHELYKTATDVGFDFVKQFSFVKSMLKDEEVKLEKSMDHDMKTKTRAIGPTILALPEKGLSHQEILNLISSSITTENSVWQNGKLSGSVYGGDRKHIEFLNDCFSYYSIANVLHPDIWPSVMKYESEIIMMAASLVNGGCSTVCGSTTSVSSIQSSFFPPSFSSSLSFY
jgi:glutamate/tyrosine decarboxylase-like PLP-dependent enzyme